MQKIRPFLWFDKEAEEAANFYTSVFPNSRIVEVSRYTGAGPGPDGSVTTVTFVLDGQEFIALNGGPHFRFNEAISFFVSCDSQEEVDLLWQALSADGRGQCGWVKDRFGVSWQIVPRVLGEMLHDKDPERSRRVMQAMLRMEKLDIAALTAAYNEA
ncbi:MAG TPA: VOC family protein [Stellaceae bacterium]|nr:VOC family protein [Stellaceae bacterium]